MQVIDTIAGWRKALDDARAAGRSVGLVPTMGALHAGHASLIDRAVSECDVVGVTVFVNPLQFGSAADLDTYPRTLDADVDLATRRGADYVFAPSQREMYPSPVQTTVTVRGLTDRWEGEGRPGHFEGVATVVTKLFAQAGPCRAYFGEKDYQQLCVVRRLVADLNLPVEVVGCPIVREPDGLALSSRNVRLSPAERAAAPLLHQALQAGAADVPHATDVMARTVAQSPLIDLQYAVAVDPSTLEPVSQAPARLLIAALVGPTRLIDNLEV